MAFTRGYRATLPFGLVPMVPVTIRSTTEHDVQTSVRVSAVSGSEFVRDRRRRGEQRDRYFQPFSLGSLGSIAGDLEDENMQDRGMAEKKPESTYMSAGQLDLSRGLIV